jgi:hypothetical protein
MEESAATVIFPYSSALAAIQTLASIDCMIPPRFS